MIIGSAYANSIHLLTLVSMKLSTSDVYLFDKQKLCSSHNDFGVSDKVLNEDALFRIQTYPLSQPLLLCDLHKNILL